MSVKKVSKILTICISDVLSLRAEFIAGLDKCISNSWTDGWEQLFLQSVVHSGNGIWFHGIKLMESGSRTFAFTSQHRQNIIRSLINHVNMRIDLDSSLHSAIQPLVNIKSNSQQVRFRYLSWFHRVRFGKKHIYRNTN